MISAFYTVILSTNFSQIILGLRSWRVPYALAFGIGLVFQIIPIIVKEFSTIMEAQSSRGLEVEQCSALAKMKNYVIVSLPLMFRVLGKGHSISLAMHYYKLDFKVRRTSYKVIQDDLPRCGFFSGFRAGDGCHHLAADPVLYSLVNRDQGGWTDDCEMGKSDPG